MPILVVITIAAVVVIVIVVSVQQAAQRRREMQSLADRLGLRFLPQRDSSIAARLRQFSSFNTGSSRHGLNTITGQTTIRDLTFHIHMGDFRYTVQSGKHSSTITFSYIVLSPPFKEIPGLILRRQNFLDRIKGALGFSDISFESETFTRRFYVQSCDRRFAYDVIHPQMMEYLMQANPQTIDIKHGICCYTNGSGTWTAAQFESHLGVISGFFERWPDYLVDSMHARQTA